MEKSVLNKKYQDLHKSPEVLKSVSRKVSREGLSKKEVNKITANPELKLEVYLDRFKEVFDREETHREIGVEAIRRWASSKFIIKEEDIPESVYILEQNIARERGYGYIAITEEYKQAKNQEIIQGQQKSLDRWIDYLSSPDAFYPDWFKYLAFRSITKMGELDKGGYVFEKRSRSSTRAFPELNSEALGMVQKMIEKANGIVQCHSVELESQELEQIAKKAQFEKLYGIALKKLEEKRIRGLENLEQIEGSWMKYNQGSDYRILEDSLQEYATGWCTASGSAESQLEAGDFYVFYSKDEKGEDKVPRIAIRMEDGEIAEIRGINNGQELEPRLIETMEEKAKTLKGFESYQKKTAHMRQLTETDNKNRAGGELTKQDLRFLYQIDSVIEGFGYETDPRIKRLLGGRDKIVDLQTILDCKRENLYLNENDILDDNTVFIDKNLRMKIAENPNAPVEILTRLSGDEDSGVRIAVAENPKTPVETLTRLSGDEDSGVRIAVAENPKTPTETLTRLSGDEDFAVRMAVAENPKTPTETLTRLSGDEDFAVRMAVAQNPNTPVEILTRLSGDEDSGVRRAVAENPDTPVETLITLSGDEDSGVRIVVAENPNAPVEILITLSGDEYFGVRRAVARNPKTPVETLTRLSKDENLYVRIAVAENLKTPVETLTRLSGDEDLHVRIAVAENPDTPVETLITLSGDEVWGVRRVVARNPNYPAELKNN
jgi:hypothetical protein